MLSAANKNPSQVSRSCWEGQHFSLAKNVFLLLSFSMLYFNYVRLLSILSHLSQSNNSSISKVLSLSFRYMYSDIDRIPLSSWLAKKRKKNYLNFSYTPWLPWLGKNIVNVVFCFSEYVLTHPSIIYVCTPMRNEHYGWWFMSSLHLI